ncbi:protein of unknown function [Rhodococcoides kroppenstedtii]|uniref:DUF4192 domain-containing protein n=1 Tax=Rhodococcoides kroppenstedtii TaxID=293050 RepID=A0A1I0SZX9_9NOCA|nr:DUF4192 family protein [Rhodococcus kroppenstedtii]SFA45061.1 protein of unknown function [Rhodococcus kroppenstedtii]
MTQRRITISTAADLIAAVPALVRFVPTDSIVVIALTGTAATFTVRIDRTAVDTQTDRIVDALTRHRATAVHIVSVSDHADKRAATTEHLILAHRLYDVARVQGNYWIPTLAEPATAQNLDTLEAIAVDPTASLVAVAAAVEAGQRIERNRDAIADRYTRTDTITPAEHADPAGVLEELAAVVYADELPSVDLIARTAAVITTPAVRDAMFRLPAYGSASAHAVMTTVARRTAAASRVHALCIVGWLNHRAGDGAAANIAYDAATTEALTTGTPHPKLLTLLQASLENAVTPAEMALLDLDPATVREHTGAHLPGAPDRD